MSPANDPKGVAAFLAACSAAFAELGLRWYLFGAQAAFFYGASRLTVDVDLTVALEGGAARRCGTCWGCGCRSPPRRISW